MDFILAHAGHDQGGFIAGFLHPITGLDHLIAAVAIGLLAALSSQRAAWLLPAMFLVGMIAGGLLTQFGVSLPGVEIGISLSVVAVGVALALRQSGPLWASASLIGLFAIFHGHAHLSEYESSTGVLGYVAGLLIATALLHVIGVAVGLKSAERPMVKVAGGAVAAMGVLLLAGLV